MITGQTDDFGVTCCVDVLDTRTTLPNVAVLAGLCGVAIGGTAAVHAMDIHSADDLRDSLKRAAAPKAALLRDSFTPLRHWTQVWRFTPCQRLLGTTAGTKLRVKQSRRSCLFSTHTCGIPSAAAILVTVVSVQPVISCRRLSVVIKLQIQMTQRRPETGKTCVDSCGTGCKQMCTLCK